MAAHKNWQACSNCDNASPHWPSARCSGVQSQKEWRHWNLHYIQNVNPWLIYFLIYFYILLSTWYIWYIIWYIIVSHFVLLLRQAHTDKEFSKFCLTTQASLRKSQGRYIYLTSFYRNTSKQYFSPLYKTMKKRMQVDEKFARMKLKKIFCRCWLVTRSSACLIDRRKRVQADSWDGRNIRKYFIENLDKNYDF